MRLLRRGGGLQPTQGSLLPAWPQGVSPRMSTERERRPVKNVFLLSPELLGSFFGLFRLFKRMKEDDLHDKMLHVLLKRLQRAVKMI